MTSKTLLLGVLFLAITLVLAPTQSLATEAQERRSYYNFLAAANGDSQLLGDLLDHYRKKYLLQRENRDNLDHNAAAQRLHTVNEYIQHHPRHTTPSSDSGIGAAFTHLRDELIPAKKNKLIDRYILLSKIFLSGSMRAPRHYQNLVTTEVERLNSLRENISFFSVLDTSGRLSEPDRAALDQAFRYYTGRSFAASDEEISNDPLMFPYEEQTKLRQKISHTLSSEIHSMNSVHAGTLNNINEILRLRQASAVAQQQHKRLVNARSEAELRQLILDIQSIECGQVQYEQCQHRRTVIVTAAKDKIVQIQRNEFLTAIDQSIAMGLVVGQISGNDDLAKTFRALGTVSQTVKTITKAIDEYRSASTAWGQYASIAMASTSVVGAFAVLGSLSQDDTNGTWEILESLEEVKEMISNLSRQMTGRFDRIDDQLARMESLIATYGELNSHSLESLANRIRQVDAAVRDSSPFIGGIEISYRNNANEKWKGLRKKYYDIVLSPSANEDKHHHLLEAFSQFFTIADFVERGEYRISASADVVTNGFSGFLENLATYGGGPLQSAFLLQAIANVSGVRPCQQLNLVGYKVTSLAAEELVRILARIDHGDFANFVQNSIDKKALLSAIAKVSDYNTLQRDNMARCFLGNRSTPGMVTKLTKDYHRAMLRFVKHRENNFFADDAVLNNLLLLKQGAFRSLSPPGGFSSAHFRLGTLIALSRSFRPENWDQQVAGITVVAHPDIGTDGHSFKLKRHHFEQLVPDHRLRVAHLVGIPVGYELYHWFQDPTKNYVWIVEGEINFDIVVALRKLRKVAHIWRWTVRRDSVEDLLDNGTVPFGSGTRPAVRIGVNKGRELYNSLSADGRFMSALTRKDYGVWTCTNLHDGLLDCRHKKSSSWIGTACRRFVHEHYFAGRVNDNFKPTSQCDAYPSAYFNALVDYNGFRKLYVDGSRKYVDGSSALSSEILSNCLWQSLFSGVCTVDGTKLVFGDVGPNRKLMQNIASMLELVREVAISHSGIGSHQDERMALLSFDELFEGYPDGAHHQEGIFPILDKVRTRLEEAISRSEHNSREDLGHLNEQIISHGFDRLGTILQRFLVVEVGG